MSLLEIFVNGNHLTNGAKQIGVAIQAQSDDSHGTTIILSFVSMDTEEYVDIVLDPSTAKQVATHLFAALDTTKGTKGKHEGLSQGLSLDQLNPGQN